ncbi:MAG: ATP-binding protein [Cyanothece sp. SIO2G6]|nr:ATP-binding protein [Cyanothece sp. SIO2G6]
MKKTAELLTTLFETPAKEQQLVSALRALDHRLKRVFLGYRRNNPIILIDLGAERALPMNVLGDGFCRLLLMLVGALEPDPKILIVDEIDLGLHVSAMRDVWKGLHRFLIDDDKQLFCATHNEDMLTSLLDAFQEEPDSIRLFRLSRDQHSNIIAQKYDYELLQDSISAGFEVR